MKLLYANDELGQHAPSWYSATVDTPQYPSLSGIQQTDVCVIGGGYTGLSAALTLAQAGKSVCVLEAHRVGWGASGRNGGQLGSGFNRHEAIASRLGAQASQTYWDLAERAKRWVLDTREQHHIDIEYVPGIVDALHRPTNLKQLQHEIDAFNDAHPGAQLCALDKSALQDHVVSDDYHAGVYDPSAGHIHPLKLAVGLSQAAENEGALLFETSAVTEVTRLVTSDTNYRIRTRDGYVLANTVVCAMNGYLDGLIPKARRDVIPINNFIAATEPLGDRIKALLPSNAAVADSRYVVNYFRRSSDNRLLFGGGENYGYRFPANIQSIVRKAMLEIFPSLEDAKLDYVWGGTLGITRTRWPSVQQLEPHCYSSSGYSGHGVALANYCGSAVASAILGDHEEFNQLSALPTGYIPGNDKIRPWLAAAAMGGSALLDRLPTLGPTSGK